MLVALHVAVAFVATYPIALSVGDRIPGGGDAYLFAWSLWHTFQAVTSPDEQLYSTALLYFPHGTSLAYHTPSLGNGFLALPLFLMGASAGAAYSVIWLFSFVASGLAATYLAKVTDASWPAAVLAGLAFAYCPFRTAHAGGHLNLLGTFWLPLVPALLWRTRTRHLGARRLLAGICYGMAALTSDWYFGVYLGWLLLFCIVALPRQSSTRARSAALFLLGAAVVLAPAYPVFGTFLSGRSHYYVPAENAYPADLLGFFLPTYRNPLFRPLNEFLTAGRHVFSGRQIEGTVSLGILPLLLAGLGWRRSHGMWKIALLFFVVLSLGPELTLLGHNTHIPLPYRLHSLIPVVRGARIPSRYVIMASLCIVPIMATGVDRLLERTPSRRGEVFGLLLFFLFLESLACPFPTNPCRESDVYRRMAADPRPGAVLMLPAPYAANAMFLQTIHGRPIVGGHIARQDPAWWPEYQDWVSGLIRALHSDPQRFRSLLRRAGVAFVVCGESAYGSVDDPTPRQVLLRELRYAFPEGTYWEDEQRAVFAASRESRQHSSRPTMENRH